MGLKDKFAFDLNCTHFPLISCNETRQKFHIFDKIIIKANDKKKKKILNSKSSPKIRETLNVDVGGKI